MPKKALQKVILLVAILVVVVGATASAATFGSRLLLYGTSGTDVSVLQEMLNNLGYLVGRLDGVFGPRTQAGVQSFQSDRGLVPDGVVGPKTYAALNGTVSAATTDLYLVRPGDTLYWIAMRYNTTVAALEQVNGLASDLLSPGQFLHLPGVPVTVPWSEVPASVRETPLEEILQEKGIPTPVPDLTVVVDKSDYTLSLFSGQVFLKSYHVALGDNGNGDKEVAGDHKTPEGRFYISQMLVLDPPDPYLGSRWMRLAYPNDEDALRGLEQGLIDQSTYQDIVAANAAGTIPPQNTALGGGIGIHGGTTQATGDHWTWGCVGLKDADVQEIFNYVSVGTSVVITP